MRAHGVRGGLRLRVASELLGSLSLLYIDERPLRLLQAQRDKSDWLVMLEGITDRDAAQALRGARVSADRALVDVGEDEFLVADLVGCTVFDSQGVALGEVTGSFDSGAHEVLEVRRADGREFMLPLVEAIVTTLDLETRRIVCDPPPGLVDLEEEEEAKP